MASENFENHCVVAGGEVCIDELKQTLSEKGISSFPLPVEFAFHTAKIEAAKAPYLAYLRQQVFSKPTIPIISGVYAKPDVKMGADYFWDVVRQPIRFSEVIRQLSKSGISYQYVDLGPSGTLATLMKYICPLPQETKVFSLLNMFSHCKKNTHQIVDALASQSYSIALI